MIPDIKILGQAAPIANTVTTLYTVPAGVTTVVSTIMICNIGPQVDQFSVLVRQAGAAVTNKQYIYSGTTLTASDTFAATIGITLAETDVVSVVSQNGSCSFNLFGQENV